MLGDAGRSSGEDGMHSEPNPYQPSIPESPVPRYSLLRIRCADAGLFLVVIVLVIYAFVTVDSDKSPSVLLAGLHPLFHIFMAVLSIAGFVTLSAATFSRERERWSESVIRFCIGAAGFGMILRESGFFGLF